MKAREVRGRAVIDQFALRQGQQAVGQGRVPGQIVADEHHAGPTLPGVPYLTAQQGQGAASSPVPGSSSSRRSGSIMSTRARFRRWAMPREKTPARSWAWAARPTRSNPVSKSDRDRRRPWAVRQKARFSSAVRPG